MRVRPAPGIAATLALAAATSLLYLRAEPSPVAVDEVVQRFRAVGGTPSPTAPPPPASFAPARPARSQTSRPVAIAARSVEKPPQAVRLAPPAEGVYVYATSGWESVDVLGGSRHDYPPQTTLTLRHSRCGFRERWDVLAERWEERDFCSTDAGDAIQLVRSYHEFFRHGEHQDLVCDEGTLARPPPAAPSGTTWTGRCASHNVVARLRGSIVGTERIFVAGRAVDAVHHGRGPVDSGGPPERTVSWPP